MTLSKLALITTCAVATAAALLTGCGQDTPQTTTPAADSSSAALEVEATKMLQAVADHDYAAAYQFRSTRCKIAVPEPDYIASMQKQFDQRDFKANPPKIIVSASGTSGFVITTNTDPRADEDDRTPRNWTFIDGKWRFDNC